MNNKKRSDNFADKLGRGVGRYARTLRKRPLFAFLSGVIAAAIVAVIIVLVISPGGSIQSTADAQGQEQVQNKPPETMEHQEPETYEDAKWKKKQGRMIYDDENYETVTGIDVSEWSLDIDWDKVKADGISFVICRIGYRGYGTGKFAFDEKLYDYLEGADAAGLKIGVYFVTQAVDEEEAVEEAKVVLERIKGYNITMPIYIDCEANGGENTRTDHLTKDDYTSNAIAFCKTIEEAGYRAGVYSNETWASQNLDLSQLTDYDIWYAKYTVTPSTDVPFNMWQYTGSGTVDGITTAADLNVRAEKKK